MAVDGRLKGDDTCLASSTLLANEEDKDIFGLVISYSVRVKLFLGALAGDLVAELPFVLMNPRWAEARVVNSRSEMTTSFPCMEAILIFLMPLGHSERQEMPLVGSFGCLKLCLFDVRELDLHL